jgi:hypothetical protein
MVHSEQQEPPEDAAHLHFPPRRHQGYEDSLRVEGREEWWILRPVLEERLAQACVWCSSDWLRLWLRMTGSAALMLWILTRL